MKKIEYVYREVMYQALEKQNKKLTQLSLAKDLKLSLSTVNYALKPLRNMGAIEVHLKNFKVIDFEKVIYYWCSIRNIEKDIIYRTRVEKDIKKIESEIPSDAIFGGYSAYKFKFKDVPADYSEVYIYGDNKIKKRFPENKNTPNLFVLKKDELMEKYGKTTPLAQIFVDLWNLKEWYAKEFLVNLKRRLKMT